MAVSRRALFIAAVSAAFPLRVVRAADAAPAVIERFYDALLAVMKDAKRLSFDQRAQRLSPAIGQTYNLPLMSRLAVGPGWAQLQPAQQQRFSDLFARYTVATYANRFDDYSGERFEVDPNTLANANGTVVQSRLVKSNGEKVALNYLMRQDGGGPWLAIDVYLSGTISQLATLRSEFAGVLQQRGGDGLLKLLEDRTAALRTG
jgi:phospholipid transport system substrate-binding protein